MAADASADGERVMVHGDSVPVHITLLEALLISSIVAMIAAACLARRLAGDIKGGDYLGAGERLLVPTIAGIFVLDVLLLAHSMLNLQILFPILRNDAHIRSIGFTLFIGSIFGPSIVAVLAVCLIAPSVEFAQDLMEPLLRDAGRDKVERTAVRLWGVGAGLICLTLLSIGYWLETKVWFFVLCCTVVMIPYAALGYVIRAALRRIRKR